MKAFPDKLLPAICLAVGIIVGSAAYGGETAHDVIPENWITHNGSVPNEAPKKKLIILPSQPTTGKPVRYPAPGFLARGNRLKTDWFQFRTLAGGTGQIDVTRTDSKSLALGISIGPETQKVVRGMEWIEFQKVQAKFEEFLFEKSACKCICLFHSRTPRQRFGEGYERQLREFWVECLKGSSYNSFAEEEKKKLFKDFPQLPPDESGRMGVIPLFPAMRLSIHWGATAVYPTGTGTDYIYSRQTVGGNMGLQINERKKTTILGNGRGWSMKTVHPNQGTLGETPPDPPVPVRPLPYGHKLEKEVAAKLVTVDNPFDLRQKGGESFRHFDGSTASKLRMYLLVPLEYTKPDFAKSGVSEMRSAQLAHESRAVDDKGATPKPESFARRFLVWHDSATDLKLVTPSFSSIEAIKAWTYPALSFGNQTWVEAELAISLNGTHVEWVPVGSTFHDVVQTEASWLLTHPPATPPSTPMLTLFRNKMIATNEPIISGNATQLRFWVVPPDFFELTEVHPGDALFYKP